MNRRTASAFIAILAAALIDPSGMAAAAADLQPRTVAAFDRYIALTESRLQKDQAFLWIDGLQGSRKQEARDQIHRKELAIDRLTTKDGGRDVDVPDGLIQDRKSVV